MADFFRFFTDSVKGVGSTELQVGVINIFDKVFYFLCIYAIYELPSHKG